MAHVVPAVSGSKLWFKVIYGAFNSTADAKNARSQLPVAIQRNAPWIRKFSAVHNEVAPDVSGSYVSTPAPAPAAPAAVAVTTPSPEVVIVSETDPTVAPATTSSTTIIVGDVVQSVASNGQESVSTMTQSAPAPQPAAESSVIQPVVTETIVQPETVEPTVQLAENAPAPAQTAPTQVAVAQPTDTKLANNDGANPALAFSQQWLPLAEGGHAESQYGLGFMHETGWGVSRDASKAMNWYKLAAEQGYAKAQYNLGMMYLLGNGVAEDEAMGLYWIQSAADQNDLRARAQLSRLRTGG